MKQIGSSILDLTDLDLCIGCGVCAGICPARIPSMYTNNNGELRPILNSPCNGSCRKCTLVCPFLGLNPSEDDLAQSLFGRMSGRWTKELGFVCNTYVGHRNDPHRHQSASGGLAGWVLENLLHARLVDRAVCVVPTGDPEQLFAYEIISDSEKVRRSCGSAYYPVELTEVLRFIRENPGRYALTALPCVVKALRLGQKQDNVLKERIGYILGLTCGQTKSKAYTAYLAACSGLKGRPRFAGYRGKSADRPANNFIFSCSNDQNLSRDLFWDQGPSYAWGNRWFTPKACEFCDDVFAELADASFMDAWLPEYIRDRGGTSLVITRNTRIDDLLREGSLLKKVTCLPITPQEVIQSQRGVIDYKRRQLASRLKMADAKLLSAIKKRIPPARSVSWLMRWRVWSIEEMRIRSSEALRFDSDDPDLDHFMNEMIPYIRHQRILKYLVRISGLFSRISNVFAHTSGEK